MSDITIIMKFCRTGDTTALPQLSRGSAVLFQKLCVVALQRPGTNRRIARLLLEYYGLDDRGERSKAKRQPLKKVERQVSTMSVALTGARAGDVLSGASKGSKGALIKIHGHDVPPMRRALDGARGYPSLWDQFLVRLGAIPYFTEMSLPQREVWLLINEAGDENSIGQEGSRIEVLQPGAGDLSTKLSIQDLNQLINGNPYSEDGYWSYKEIENMVPGKPGSQARRHTLILIRSFWKITTDYKVVQSFDKPTINVMEGLLLANGKELSNKEIFVLNNITKEVVRKGAKWMRPSGSQGVQELGLQVAKKRVDLNTLARVHRDTRISFAYRQFTGASYKSLIQKIVRFRPKLVDLGGGDLVAAEDALYVAMRSLAEHPGAFIPDIQRFVTGMESLSKRLGVIIAEDSMVPLDRLPNIILSLLSGSLLCQRVRAWVPPKDLLESWFEYGLTAWRSLEAVKVDFQTKTKKEPYVLKYGQPPLETASAIMDELRSFPTDLGLVRGWAREYPDFEIVKATRFPEIMPLGHCVDQHWAPGVVHYFNPSFVINATKGRSTSAPFLKLFGLIWDRSSSINPRRMHLDWKTFEGQPDVAEIRRAQELFLVAKQKDHKPRTELGGDFSLKYTLKDSWLAGMMGAVEVKANRKLRHPAMLVTLSADDPLQLLAIRRPSRNMSEEPLSEEAKEWAIEIVKTRLKIGISLNKAKAPAPALEKCTVILKEGDDGDYYVIKQPGKRLLIPWDKIKKLDIRLPLLEEMGDRSLFHSLTNTSIGVEEGAEQELLQLVSDTSPDVVRHALIYLSTFSSSIEMNRVSRDGGGTQKAVSIHDVGAYQFMLKLSTLYPAALRPTLYKPSAFDVPIGPLLWTIRERISKLVSKGEVGDKGWRKVEFKDSKRTLWAHQTGMVQDMVRNRKTGDKGNFIWSTVGLGKTASILTYLQYLKEYDQLPRYIIYTLPQSAIKSIIQEIRYFHVPINLIIPLKDNRKHAAKYTDVKVSQSCVPLPHTINLIEHDHLRRCTNVLLEYAPRSFFVVDEVHKTLNDTLRTSVALEIAHLSRDFVVLTGTPVIDNDTYKLIGWLEQVVPFEVTQKNFWVAANAMIAKTINTGIKVNDKDVVADFTVQEEREYRPLVPPALGGNNTNPLHEDWLKATKICYRACDREMIKLSLRLLDRGVMLVAKDAKHQEILYRMLVKKVKPEDIFIMKSGDSIFLTEDAVEEGKVHGYKVVIVPQRKAEGYTLTYLSAMVTSVYPGNNATREQLRGRINRISQKREEVLYRTVHAGLLTSILHNHNSAKNLSIALKSLAQQVKG
jgi:hypothetical protein